MWPANYLLKLGARQVFIFRTRSRLQNKSHADTLELMRKPDPACQLAPSMAADRMVHQRASRSIHLRMGPVCCVRILPLGES